MNRLFVGARGGLLRILRVPPDPEPPAGAAGSLRVFRAGRNYYRLKFWLWSAKQVLALLTFVFTLWILHRVVDEGLGQLRERAETRNKSGQVVAIRAVERYSGWLPALECLGFAFALLQLPFTYALIRLDYEQRWYLVTDRSLRIRAGVWNVREMTLSFANIQQITLQQGPLQRLLGLADLVVTTAGGGAPIAGQPGQPSTPWHTGILRAVDNADEIRDLMQERLRQLKSAGTGDHDDAKDALAAVPLPPPHGNVSHDNSLAAARELLREVRALHNAW